MRIRSLLVAALAATLVLAGCGGDDDGDDAAPTTEEGAGTSTDAEGPSDDGSAGGGGDAADPYDGHTSEVYEDPARWICRPDLDDDLCRDLDVTTFTADGGRTVEEREADLDAPVDCFYVYPTVSPEEGVNADLEWGPDDAEALTVVAQAAQYARSCRVFAPVYRQLTLNGIFQADVGEGRDIAYGDVVDAWKTYISQWNEGRGVVVIGHSQGAGHLRRLLEEEVDGVPEVRERLVAAHLFGGTVEVPEGEVVGGSFDEIPGCTSADEAGCVVTWSSYPAEAPPGPEGMFARAGEGTRALCVDAVGLLGRERASAVAPVRAPLIGSGGGDLPDVETRFVAFPESLTVSCETTEQHDHLAVGIADPADPRSLDGFVNETLGRTWGLHLVDMTVALDDLVDLVARQAEAHTG